MVGKRHRWDAVEVGLDRCKDCGIFRERRTANGRYGVLMYSTRYYGDQLPATDDAPSCRPGSSNAHGGNHDA